MSNQFLNNGSTASGSNDDTKISRNGTIPFSANQSMGSNKLTFLANGTNSSDAVNKGQLDLMLPLAGGTMTGNVNFNNNNLSNVYNLTVSNDATITAKLTSPSFYVGATQILNGSRQFYNLASVDSASFAKNGVVILPTATEINTLYNVTPGTVANGKAVVVDSNNDVSGFRNVSISGDLTVSGTSTSINATNLSVADPLTRIANNNPADVLDIGMYGKYVSGTTKYTGIFRDASDGRYRFFTGLTEEPTTTVNISGTGYTNGDIVVGDVNCTSVTLNGTSIGAQLNTAVVSSNALLTPLSLNSFFDNINLQKASTTHASFNDTGYTTRSNAAYNIEHTSSAGSQDFTIRQNGVNASRLILESYGNTLGAITLNSITSGITLNSNTYTTVQNAGLDIATFGPNAFVTTVNVPYEIRHSTNAISQDFKIYKQGADASKLLFESDGTTLSSVHLKSTGGGVLLEPFTNISCYGPLLTRGVGVEAGGLISSATIGTNSAIAITSSTNFISISTANSGRCLTRLSYTGSLLSCQRITISNKSGVTIVLGHLAVASAGAIAGWWYELYNNMQVDVVYDSAFDRFICPGIEPPVGKWKALRWSGDQSLGLFVSTAYTYTVKINFANANATINGVSGFENIAAGTNSGTGWTRTVSGSHLDYNTANGRWLTDTECAKLINFTYNETATTFTFTGLTNGNLYGVFIYSMVFANDTRSQILQEDSTGIKDQISTQLYATNSGSNEPAMVTMFLWRHMTSATTKTFTFTNVSTTAHRYAITVINLGAV